MVTHEIAVLNVGVDVLIVVRYADSVVHGTLTLWSESYKVIKRRGTPSTDERCTRIVGSSSARAS
jgi:hypothetical protein